MFFCVVSMKQVSTDNTNASNAKQDLEARLDQLFAQLEAATPQPPSGDRADDTPAKPLDQNPVVVAEQDFVPLRDGGIDGRGAFGGNRLLGAIRQALADDLDVSQALGNERILFQNIADTIEAQNFTPFYEGSATGFFTGDFLSSVSNAGLIGPFSSIAFAPPHLAPLLNENIERLIQTNPFDDILPIDRTNNVDPVQPNAEILSLHGTSEDGVLEEQLFATLTTGFVPNILTPPSNGSIVFNDDGSFVFTPDPDFSGVQVVEIEFFDPNNGSVRIEVIEINVTPVLDVPVLLDGSTTVNEDNTIPLGQDIDITTEDATDGSQTLAITLTGIPSNVLVSATTQGDVTLVQQPDGSYVLSGGTPADVLAVLDTLVLDAPEHNADDFVVTITATATEEDGSTQTVTANHAVIIVEVADQPTVVGGEFVTDEDVPVVLTGLGGELVDQDGSETLIFELANVPEGASFDGAGTFDPATGIWTFTPEEIEAGLTFVPPEHEDGTFEFEITAISTETSTGEQSRNTSPITVTIEAEADAPTVSGSSSINEDEPLPLGDDIDIGLIDQDGSETLSVSVSGFPFTSEDQFDFTNVGGATVAYDPATGTLTISGGTAQDVLDTLALSLIHI